MIEHFKMIYKNHPKILYILYIIIITIIIDFCMAKILWERLATNDYYGIIGFRCQNNYFHHSLEKNVCVHQLRGNIKYNVMTNSLGFKDSHTRDINLLDGGKRILFIGDSFVEGAGFPFEKTFVGIIGKNLKKRGIEVLNAGVSSYCPHLYFLKVQYLIDEVKLKFDKLVVFIDMSDISDEIVYRNYVPDKRENLKSIGYYARLYMIKYSVIGNILDRIRSMMLKNNEKGKKVLMGQIRGIFQEPTVLKPLYYGVRMSYEEYYRQLPFWYNENNYEKWGREGASLADDYMSRLVALCKANNIEVTIVVYPWPQQVLENRDENEHTHFWRNFANKNDVEFVNLFPLFMRPTPEIVIKKYYLHGDVHFNEVGQQMVAQEYLNRFSGQRKKDQSQ